MLLSLNSLVQTIAPATAFHDTSCLLIHNLHLSVHHDILVVVIKHGVCFQELLQGVYSLALYTIVSQHLVFLVKTLLV